MSEAPRPDDLRSRATSLFEKISKRANLHGREFTMMALEDDAVIQVIEKELEFVRVER